MASALRRKHMDLKRQGSFNRLQLVPHQFEEWFRTDLNLHRAIEDFAHQNCSCSSTFSKTTDDSVELSSLESPLYREASELDHQVFQLLKQFTVEIIEVQLSTFRAHHRLSDSEFDAVIQLSMDEDEEKRSFFRWTEVSSMPAFLVLMRCAYKHYGAAAEHSTETTEIKPRQPAVDALLHFIDYRSMEERNQFRRKTRLRPLLTKWCPSSFADILDLIAASSTEFPPNLETAQKKNLARWRVKLSTKAIGPGGFEIAPPRNEEEWLQYLERYCESMPDSTFESFMAYSETFLGGRPEEGEELKDRRASWLCFQQLDPLHTGAVYLEDLLEELTGFEGLFTADSQRKIVFRKLCLKVDAEDKNLRRDAASTGGGMAPQHSLVAEALQAMGRSPSTLGLSSADDHPTCGSVSAQSAEVGGGSTSHSEPLEAAHGHAVFVLLTMNQFHRALDFIYKNCRNPEFRQSTCRTFRSFVVALHKLIAQHCDHTYNHNSAK
ncbi:Hypothetical protein, putative [Bodo saltans]|uniref:Uncharacterized protein n=1 Tax=Bodo saltans TaxID=75058 RepID=A0A0S4JLE5_BODSA|nr:Hypothetical protein, putative [Bodo saltans]|eukprot:CUG90736.1 Hypothetical protein, putative [Bodo saltans]